MRIGTKLSVALLLFSILLLAFLCGCDQESGLKLYSSMKWCIFSLVCGEQAVPLHPVAASWYIDILFCNAEGRLKLENSLNVTFVRYQNLREKNALEICKLSNYLLVFNELK